jgi:hypothetical protein
MLCCSAAIGPTGKVLFGQDQNECASNDHGETKFVRVAAGGSIRVCDDMTLSIVDAADA